MSIRRPDPRHPGGETPLDEDPLASAFWIRAFRREDADAVREWRKVFPAWRDGKIVTIR